MLLHRQGAPGFPGSFEVGVSVPGPPWASQGGGEEALEEAEVRKPVLRLPEAPGELLGRGRPPESGSPYALQEG